MTRKISSGTPWEPVAGYSRAVAAGDYVFVAGCTSVAGGEVVHEGDAAAQTTPLVLEQWTSGLIGEIWKHRSQVPAAEGVDAMLRAGEPILGSLAELGTASAKTTLAAVGQLDRGLLGHCARRLAAALDGSTPGWLEEMGMARIEHAFSDCRPRDGEALLLEAHPPAGEPHMLAVFVDARMGGIAKHLDLVRAMDPAGSAGSDEPDFGGLRFVEVDPELACERVRTAIDRADAAYGLAAKERFVYYRALALARVQPPSLIA